jgi:hypothetical protein
LSENAGAIMDLYDHTPWTEMDMEDLKSAIEYGRSIE